jgi:GNAT superfamily N-acetyltransferase
MASMSVNNIRNIVEEPPARFAECAKISIGFEVRSVLEFTGDDPNSAVLTEVPVAHPWTKDYDTIEGEGPANWARRWDVTNWALLSAYSNGKLIGSCAVARDTPGVNMLQSRSDWAAIWDLRIAHDYRRHGIGSQLFRAAAGWARGQACRELHVETQNINVPACRFYQRQGCRLRSIDRFAYEGVPDEIRLIWSLEL